MVDVLKQCYFCEDWFPGNQLKELKLQRHPSSSYEEVYACENCLKTTRVDRLAARAAKAMANEGCNEIEVTDGELKVRLVRFTPAPYLVAPWTGTRHWPPYQF